MSALATLLVASLILAAFAAASETALTSVSRIRMRSIAEEGDRRAEVVVRLHNDPNAYLSTILSINTVAVIVASTSATLRTRSRGWSSTLRAPSWRGIVSVMQISSIGAS